MSSELELARLGGWEEDDSDPSSPWLAWKRAIGADCSLACPAGGGEKVPVNRETAGELVTPTETDRGWLGGGDSVALVRQLPDVLDFACVHNDPPPATGPSRRSESELVGNPR